MRGRLSDKSEHENDRKYADDQSQHLEAKIDREEYSESSIMIWCRHSTFDYDVWSVNVLVTFNRQGNGISATKA